MWLLSLFPSSLYGLSLAEMVISEVHIIRLALCRDLKDLGVSKGRNGI